MWITNWKEFLGVFILMIGFVLASCGDPKQCFSKTDCGQCLACSNGECVPIKSGCDTQSTTLISIAVTPTNTIVTSGYTKQFIATGTYSDSTTKDITNEVTWVSSNTDVATISTTGLAASVAAGETTISATSGTISGSTTLTVTVPVTLSSIAVTPANPTVTVGASQQFVATGTYSNSTTKDITTKVTWDSSNTDVATISTTGLAASVAAGSTIIQATYGSISNFTTMTVTNLDWSDDFESYALSTFPSSGGWQLVYNGSGTNNQYVSNTHSVSGYQSLHLQGSYCWGGNAYHVLNIPSHVALEAKIYVDSIVTCGCEQVIAGVGLFNPNIGAWGTNFGAIYLKCDGNIYAAKSQADRSSDVLLTPYSEKTWYELKMEVDLSARIFSVYINGALHGSDIQILDNGMPSGIEVGAAHGSNPTVWFDDVRVYSW